jgi:hypothetical protein
VPPAAADCTTPVKHPRRAPCSKQGGLPRTPRTPRLANPRRCGWAVTCTALSRWKRVLRASRYRRCSRPASCTAPAPYLTRATFLVRSADHNLFNLAAPELQLRKGHWHDSESRARPTSYTTGTGPSKEISCSTCSRSLSCADGEGAGTGPDAKELNTASCLFLVAARQDINTR